MKLEVVPQTSILCFLELFDRRLFLSRMRKRVTDYEHLRTGPLLRSRVFQVTATVKPIWVTLFYGRIKYSIKLRVEEIVQKPEQQVFLQYRL